MFSLVIPYRNRRDLLPRTLRSVVAQCYRPLQVVLVDNGSTDGSNEVCRTFIEATQQREEGRGLSFELLSEPTPGAAAARNAGLRASSSEWVYFFDSDDELSPDFLTDAAEAIRRREEKAKKQSEESAQLDLVAAATRMVFPDGRERVRKVFFNASPTDQILCGMLATQGIVIRRTFLVEQGGWNDALPYWNDWELGCRLLLAHPQVEWLRGRAYHRIHQHADSITGADFTSRLPFALRSLEAVERAVRRAHDADLQCGIAPREVEKTMRRTLFALRARRAILMGHVAREARGTSAARPTANALANGDNTPFLRLLRTYVAHGGRAAWRIARLALSFV